MDKIKATAIIKDRTWILKKHNKKIGMVVGNENNCGYRVSINGHEVADFDSLTSLKESNLFKFTEIQKPTARQAENVHGYPTKETAFNPVWNVQYKLPLYTKEDNSKSWYAAGYYRVSIKGVIIDQFCPKLITLQRNTFKGPYKALNQFNALYE